MMRQPQMSGWCGTPATDNPEESHARCRGGNTANPGKEFQPCPCRCHYVDLEQFDCECGGLLVETAWTNEDPEDVDDEGNPEPVYVHIAHDGTLIGQMCP